MSKNREFLRISKDGTNFTFYTFYTFYTFEFWFISVAFWQGANWNFQWSCHHSVTNSSRLSAVSRSTVPSSRELRQLGISQSHVNSRATAPEQNQSNIKQYTEPTATVGDLFQLFHFISFHCTAVNNSLSTGTVVYRNHGRFKSVRWPGWRAEVNPDRNNLCYSDNVVRLYPSLFGCGSSCRRL